MRKKIVGSSWKMHINSLEDAKSLATEIKGMTSGLVGIELFLIPTFPMIDMLIKLLKDSSISVGAQNMCAEEIGAYTGEVPALVLEELGCKYVEIGHAERRELYGENNLDVNKKVKLAIKHNLIPIICVGETGKEKSEGYSHVRLKTQLLWALDGLSEDDIKKVIIAYEPVWAIGQQEAADCDYVEEIHSYMRHLIREEFSENVADSIRIIYGGSVNPESASKLSRLTNVDGLFIGRFGLKAKDFFDIVVSYYPKSKNE